MKIVFNGVKLIPMTVRSFGDVFEGLIMTVSSKLALAKNMNGNTFLADETSLR